MSEEHDASPVQAEAIHLELQTSAGKTRVGGAVVLGRPRLLRVDGISVEVPLEGDLVYMRNIDVPGVIGHVGKILGDHRINIANFSLGREDREPTVDNPLHAIAVVETDGVVGEVILDALKENPAVLVVRALSMGS